MHSSAAAIASRGYRLIMSTTGRFFTVFSLDEQQYALDVHSIFKVIRAVETIPLPEAPDMVQGLINMGGRIIPLIDIRRRLHLPFRPRTLYDRFIICKTSDRVIAFVVDEVCGIIRFSDEQVQTARNIFPRMEEFIRGVGCLPGNTVLIYDMDKLLDIRAVAQLDQLIEEVG